MKDRPKLGRGLSDISPFFLSGTSGTGQQHQEMSSLPPRVKTVYICHPASPLIQSFFTANLALELAKNRHGVQVWDCSMSEEARLTVLMHSLMNGKDEEQDGQAELMLYGLPAIVIMDGRSGGLFNGTVPSQETPGATDGGEHCCMLVSACPDPEFILKSDPADVSIILARMDELSLLQCYAYIKTIRTRSENGSVWLVFDGEGDGRDHHLTFERLSGFVRQRLGCAVGFLGTLVHDEPMERSIREEKPLVLFTGHSAARDALTDICTRFIGGLDPAGNGAGA